MVSKHTSIIVLHIFIVANLLSSLQPVDSTAGQSSSYPSYFLGEVRASRGNVRFAKSSSSSSSSEESGSASRQSKSFELSDPLNRGARVNSRRFSKSFEEELENSTVAAFENNTLEEEMVSSTTADGSVSYFPSRNDKPSGKVEEVSGLSIMMVVISYKFNLLLRIKW